MSNTIRPAALAAEPVGEGPAAWLYKGDPDFDGTTWRDNWRVTTDEQVARFKARPDEPIPLFRRPAAPPAPEPGERPPSGYAYRYPDGICFNNGKEVNGCRPSEAIPYWFSQPPAPAPAAEGAKPVGEGEAPSAADLLPAEPPSIQTTMAMQYRSAWREGVEDGWNEARATLARWGRPAAPPAPDHVNLIGFAFGREPWATWLRKGGCLESAHCELSDLMLAAIVRWGRPTAPPAPEPGEVAS